MILIDTELWQKTRAGARAGRGFRYQDAVGALFAVSAWSGEQAWSAVIPEGVDDITLHGNDCEIRAQLKARHDPQATFSLKEVATHLAKSVSNLPDNWPQESRIYLALVLERPVAGLTQTGWRASLRHSGQPLDALIEALGQTMNTSPETVEALLERTYLVVEQNPLDRAIPQLETHAGLIPAAARLVLQQLREVAGAAADQNFSASAKKPSSLGATLVQERIDAVRGIIDPAGFLALTDGLCEVANFDEPLASADFYSGVNVMPGHVGAGLVFERPEYTAEILEGLESQRIALVAGPSGAGKSALAWLAAYHTRHAVRWYRVRRVGHGDVGRLTQLAKALEAKLERPVGFMVDDVGRDETAGWDALVRESEAFSGLLLLGSVREEDVFTLSTAVKVPVIRPLLSEDLAERIWKALSSSGTTKFSHWREPFESSKGLLLEYTHLLTEGRRLAETIQEQVRRRLAEGRDDELVVLRAVAFAAAHGGAVDQVRLHNRLGWESPRFARALRRLVNEHAIRQRSDGALAGLHEIRSTYLDDALRGVLEDPVTTSLCEAAHGLCESDFAHFIVRVLRRWPEQESALVKALSQRVGEVGLSRCAPIFHGLGLATADRIAVRWLEISRKAGVEDRLAGFVLSLMMVDADLSVISQYAKLEQAKDEFASVVIEDLRDSLIEKLPEQAFGRALELDVYHELIATLLPLKGCRIKSVTTIAIGLFNEVRALSDVPLTSLLDTIRTAHEIGVQVAQSIVDAAGGADILLERLYNETPWVTRPLLGEVDGKMSVSGDVRVISDEAQPDAHGDVVRLCELMLAAAPNAGLAISNAVSPNGRPAGIGDFEVATKRILREYLPTSVRVAWNRAQLRAVQRLVGASQETGRTIALARAIEELETRLQEAGDMYCRMETPTSKWRLSLKIRALLTDMVPPPPVSEVVPSAFDQGTYDPSDSLHRFVTDVQRLIEELTDGVSEKPALMAARTADLARLADKLTNPENWRLIGSAPLGALNRMRDMLWDIRAVLGDAANDPARRRTAALRFSRRSRRHPVLSRAAQDARLRAEIDIAERKKLIESTCADAGLQVQVYSKERSNDRGYIWPDVDYAALLVTNSIIEWLSGIEHFQAMIQSITNGDRFSYAPVINGRIPPMAVLIIQNAFPHTTFEKEWSEYLPYGFVEVDETFAQFTAAVDGLTVLSAIFGERGRSLNEVESSYAANVMERVNASLQFFASNLDGNQDEIVSEAIGFLVRCFNRVRDEFETRPEGESLAVEALKWTENVMSDFTLELVHHRVALMEWHFAQTIPN